MKKKKKILAQNHHNDELCGIVIQMAINQIAVVELEFIASTGN